MKYVGYYIPDTIVILIILFFVVLSIRRMVSDSKNGDNICKTCSGMCNKCSANNKTHKQKSK